MNYEDILQQLGGFGTYQYIVILLVVIPVCFDGATTMMLVFILGDHAHRCRLPDVGGDVYSTNINQSDTGNSSMYQATQCFLKELNGTDIECSDWVYDTTTYSSTLISKFNLVCRNKFMRSHVLFSHFLGAFLNAIICGFACDKWGRKPVFIVGIFLLVIPNVIRPWMPNLFLVGVGEFLNATGSNLCYVVPFMIVTELVDPPHRVLASFAIYFSYCIGEYWLFMFAYFIRDWETLIIVVGAPIAACFFIFIFVAESPRWLLVKDKKTEAMKIFHKIAKYNKAEVNFKPENVCMKDEGKLSILQGLRVLIKSRKMVVRFCILFFNWFSISLIYFGISMNTGDLGGNAYLNYIISTLVETIGVLLCFFAERYPRKRLYCPAMIIGGVACLSTIFTTIFGGKSLHWLTIAMAMVGKLGVTAAFFVIYLITSELFPTYIRASMFGLCNMGARVGAMASSYIGKLGVLVDSQYGSALPLIIFGCVGTLAGLLTLILPETRNTVLPETLEQALQLDRVHAELSTDPRDEKIPLNNVG